jgi:hypothetical protein
MIFLQALPVAIGERKKRLARYTPAICKWPKVDWLSRRRERGRCFLPQSVPTCLVSLIKLAIETSTLRFLSNSQGRPAVRVRHGRTRSDFGSLSPHSARCFEPAARRVLGHREQDRRRREPRPRADGQAMGQRRDRLDPHVGWNGVRNQGHNARGTPCRGAMHTVC